MIRFFRNIRKSLVKDGKFTQYITYALGEVLLVMIGILLALQVNNWNEQRKSDEMMLGRVKALMKDLEHNIGEANAIIAFADTYDSIFDGVISKTATNNPVDNFTTLLGTRTANFYKESLLSVLGNEEKLPESFISLVPEFKELDRLFQSQEKWEEITLQDREEITKNVIYTGDYDFTSLDRAAATEEFEKLISSNQFRNRVLLSYGNTFLVENAWDVTQIRAASLILLFKLKLLLEGREEISVSQFFEQKGLIPFTSFDCGKEPKTSRYSDNFGSYRMAFPFYNASDEIRYIDFLDAEYQVYKTIALKANEFHFNAYELYDEDRFSVRDDQGCLVGYEAMRNGFLVIAD